MTTDDGKQIEEMVDKYTDELLKKAEREPMQPFTEDEYKE